MMNNSKDNHLETVDFIEGNKIMSVPTLVTKITLVDIFNMKSANTLEEILLNSSKK